MRLCQANSKLWCIALCLWCEYWEVCNDCKQQHSPHGFIIARVGSHASLVLCSSLTRSTHTFDPSGMADVLLVKSYKWIKKGKVLPLLMKWVLPSDTWRL